MNEFRVKYIKLATDYFIDFLSEENKTLLITDKDQTVILDAFQVKPNNRYKFLDWVQKARIKWNFPASWSGNPTDMILTEEVYKFGVLESVNTNLWLNVTAFPGITFPDTTITDLEGNTIVIPGGGTPSTITTNNRTFAEMYAEATLQGVFFGEIEMPEFYVGAATPSSDLFVLSV
jgi:hypothetical protein